MDGSGDVGGNCVISCKQSEAAVLNYCQDKLVIPCNYHLENIPCCHKQKQDSFQSKLYCKWNTRGVRNTAVLLVICLPLLTNISNLTPNTQEESLTKQNTRMHARAHTHTNKHTHTNNIYICFHLIILFL